MMLQILQRERTGEHDPCDIKFSHIVGLDAPFDQGDLTVLDFDAGDAARMNAASGVKIAGIFVAQHRAVRVSGHEVTAPADCPSGQPALTFMAAVVVFCCTGGVKNAHLL